MDLLRPDALFLLLAAPCVGSFLGVVVERLPAGRPLVWGRSACPHCGRRLGLVDLVPLVGWLVGRGRCRTCGQALGVFYPAIELLALLVALWSLAVVPGWPAWATCGLGWALLALAAIDWRHLILPDSLTLPLVPAGLAVTWWLRPERLVDHAIGAVAGFAFLALVAALYHRLRGRHGLGLGDAKLLAAAGAWVSWQGLPTVVLWGAAAGLLGALVQVRLGGTLDPQRELPFGPYLAGGLWLVWLYGPLGFG
jgi:leader peptidase (prepilin peptidase)/N-methyltransferase